MNLPLLRQWREKWAWLRIAHSCHHDLCCFSERTAINGGPHQCFHRWVGSRALGDSRNLTASLTGGSIRSCFKNYGGTSTHASFEFSSKVSGGVMAPEFFSITVPSPGSLDGYIQTRVTKPWMGKTYTVYLVWSLFQPIHEQLPVMNQYRWTVPTIWFMGIASMPYIRDGHISFLKICNVELGCIFLVDNPLFFHVVKSSMCLLYPFFDMVITSVWFWVNLCTKIPTGLGWFIWQIMVFTPCFFF